MNEYERRIVYKMMMEHDDYDRGKSHMEQSMGQLENTSKKTHSSMKTEADKGYRGMALSAEKNLDGAQKSLGNMADKSMRHGKRFTAGVTVPIMAAFTGIFAGTMKAVEHMDDMAKSSERLGVTTDYYQEMSYWASQNGLSQDQMEKAVRRLNQRIGQAADGNNKYTESLLRMGYSQSEIDNGTIETEEAMTRYIKVLSEMDSEQEKASAAAEIFGQKMATDLMPAIQDGSLSLEEAKEAAHELGLVLDGDLLDTAEEVNDLWDDIKRTFGAVGMELAAEFLPIVKDVLELIRDNLPEIRETLSNFIGGVTDAIQKFVGWYRELSPEMQKFINYLGLAVVAGGPALMMLSGLFRAVSILIGPFKLIAGLIGRKGLAGAFSFLGKRGLALLGPLGLVASAGLLLFDNFDFVKGLFTDFGGTMDSLGEGLSDFGSKVTTVYDDIRDDGIVNWLGDLKDGVLGLFQDDGLTGVDILSDMFDIDPGTLEDIFSPITRMFHKSFQFLGFDTDNWSFVEENAREIMGDIQRLFEGEHITIDDIRLTIEETDFDPIIDGLDGVGGTSEEVSGRIIEAFDEALREGEDVGDALKKAMDSVFGESDDYDRGVLGGLLSDLRDEVYEWNNTEIEDKEADVDVNVNYHDPNGYTPESIFNTGDYNDVGLQGMFGGIFDNFDNLNREIEGLGPSFSEAFDEMKESIGGVRDYFGDIFDEMFESFGGVWDKHKEPVMGAVDTVLGWIVSAIDSGFDFVGWVSPHIEEGWKSLLDNLGDTLDFGADLLDGILSIITGAIDGDWSKIQEGVGDIAIGIWDLLVSSFNRLFFDSDEEEFDGIGDWISRLFGRVKDDSIEELGKIWHDISGFLTRVWNRLLEMPMEFVEALKLDVIWEKVSGFFSRIWEGFIGFISNIGIGLKEGFDRFVEDLGLFLSTLWGGITTFFSELWEKFIGFKDRLFETIVQWIADVVARFISWRDRLFEIVGNIRDGITNRIDDARQWVTDKVTSLVERATEKFNEFKERVFGIFGDVKDNIKGVFDDVVEWGKELPERIGDGIKKGVSFITDAIKGMGNSMVKTLQNVVNRVIGGFNVVLGKLGIKDGIPEWEDIPTFSKGTGGIKKDSLITVGDKGPGNFRGGTRELVRFPNGRVSLFDEETTFLAPKGTEVLSNTETEKIISPERFSNGTVDNALDWIKERFIDSKDWVVDKAGNVTDFVGDTWNAITDPSAWVEKFMGLFSDGFKNFAGLPLKLGNALMGQLGDAGAEMFNRKGKEELMMSDFSGNVMIGGSPMIQPFGRYVGGIGFNDGIHYGVDFDKNFEPVRSPVSGRVRDKTWDYGGGNTVEMESGSPEGKLFHWFMHLSKRLVNPGDRVKKGQVIGISGNSGQYVVGDGHLHYQLMKGGIGNNYAINPMPFLKGGAGQFNFAEGGLLREPTLALGGERGEEAVIPLDGSMASNRRAFKMLKYVNNALGVSGTKNKTTDQIGEVSGGGSSIDEVVSTRDFKELIERVGSVERAIYLLVDLVDRKELKAVLDGEEIKNNTNKRNDRDENLRKRGKRY